MPVTSHSAGKMHAGEVSTSANLVRRLLKSQFPHWAELPISPVPSAGTDNALFRLGDEMVARLPRIDWAVGQVEKERQWLPKLAPFLPLAIPAPLATGCPGEGYPWHWSVYRWLDGENLPIERIADREQAAVDLARFIVALRQIDTAGGPLSGSNNSSRGVPLASRDAETRAAFAQLNGALDIELAGRVWDRALRAAPWAAPPVWIHGDLQSGNLLAQDGRLSAVIDFGCLGVGDPATDVMAAWLFLSAGVRDVFRKTLAVDDATWARARGWALSVSVIALPYYRETNPVLAGISRRAIGEVLRDFREQG